MSSPSLIISFPFIFTCRGYTKSTITNKNKNKSSNNSSSFDPLNSSSDLTAPAADNVDDVNHEHYISVGCGVGTGTVVVIHG